MYQNICVIRWWGPFCVTLLGIFVIKFPNMHFIYDRIQLNFVVYRVCPLSLKSCYFSGLFWKFSYDHHPGVTTIGTHSNIIQPFKYYLNAIFHKFGKKYNLLNMYQCLDQDSFFHNYFLSHGGIKKRNYKLVCWA